MELITENIKETIDIAITQPGHTNLMYNQQTGQIAKRNMKDIWTTLHWCVLTDKNYPVYEGDTYIRDSQAYIDEENDNKPLDPFIYVVPCGMRFPSYSEMGDKCKVAVIDGPDPGGLNYTVSGSYQADFEHKLCKGCLNYPIKN